MIDFSLTEEQQLLQRTSRNFARAEIVPAATLLMKARESGTNQEPWPFCADLFRKGWELKL